ncbi:integrin beta-2 [Brachyhypopomus gauderio]|uniref:integrin beta-2 n=1 Tax=Brachyhypopomus gauderio TaxID=698409 RepID=UPI004041CD4E
MHQALRLRIILLLSFGAYVFSEDQCMKASVTTCDDCIKSGPACAWCQDLTFIKPGEQEAVRCDTEKVLQAKGCKGTKIISPTSTNKKDKDKPLSKGQGQRDPIQIKPQEITLELRPGHPFTFEFKFRRAEGYPIDLYYLMDLSYSMEDDLKNVKNLGIQLLNKLKSITGHARIGFGSFVDKTLLPFTDTNEEKLKKPCPDKEKYCQPAFGFKHVLSLTEDAQLFTNMVSAQYISGNLDTPEGSLDAIMQAVTCVDQIGWGNSTRLLVLATDAGFHMAGDGKLAGILEPNGETCQLDTKHMYSKSNVWDYPSVGQIARKLEEQNIQPIFAVTKEVKDVYSELSKLIPKSEVEELSADSSNVVNLIVNAYNKLSSNVIVTHDALPEELTIKYKSSCSGGDKVSEKEGTCNNVAIGDEVTFYITVKAESCIDVKSFNIGPLGFREKLKVNVKTRCKCECDNEHDLNDHCNKQGHVVCGTCSCQKGFLGQRCECSLGKKDEATLRAQCRKDNGTECEGRGDCECGVCKCHLTEGGNYYYGPHCQCDDEHCEKFQNKLCGGNGKCRCGECQCSEGFEGTACQCKKTNDACVTGESECHGRGKCLCNQCVCQRDYKGPKCEKCHTCQLPCQDVGKCIECLAFGTGPLEKNCSQSCTHLQQKQVEKLISSDCRVKDHEGCWIFFSMKELDGFDKYYVEILKDRECPEGPNVTAIVGGSLAGVALIGLLLLLIIKGIIYAKDLKEWKNFEKEKQRSQWAKGDNPLFQKATTTVANPAFTGDS